MCEFHGSNGNGFGDIWWTDKLLSSLALQGSGSQMANNCNLIKSIYRIDSNGIVTGSSTVFRHKKGKLIPRQDVLANR